jgi:type IV secretion system protein VirB4
MLLQKKQRKSDKDLYNLHAEDFIPVACHFDSNTLLTKNGELVQTIEIPGISAESLGVGMDTVTSAIRNSLAQSLLDDASSCWIHTIRRQQNIDDNIEHKHHFPKSLHAVWSKKQNLSNSFVNIIYITIVVKGMKTSFSSIDGLIGYTSLNSVINSHEKHLNVASEKVYEITNNILGDMKKYGASRMGIRTTDSKVYSDTSYIYSHISRFSEKNVELPISDLSKFIAVEKYAVGSGQLEVTDGGYKKFASIFSIREYHHANQEDLFCRAMQLPIDMIATEIIYPVSSKEARDKYKYQDYILGVSNDDELGGAKGINLLMDEERDGGFIKQQLSIMVIADDKRLLEQNLKKLSRSLCDIGVLHVREDINLENIFWSQLPANFTFIRRAQGNVIENIGAFSSILSTPHGTKASKWGRYITVMPGTENTPYFLNLHASQQTGHTCFFGNKGSGKTTLMNFMVSESMKYDPTIIYISRDETPKLFIKALGGVWHDNAMLPKLDNPNYIAVIVDILSGKYSNKMSNVETKTLDKLLKLINDTKSYEEAAKAIENFDFGGDCNLMKKRLLDHLEYFTSKNFTISKSNIVGMSLKDIESSNDFDLRVAIVISSLKLLGIDKESPKILILDEMEYMFDHVYFDNNIKLFYELAKIYNIAILGTVDTKGYIDIKHKGLWNEVDKNTDLKVVMPHQNISYDLCQIFGLTEEEKSSLVKTQYDSVFIVKPTGGKSIVIDFNSSGIENEVRILAGWSEDLKLLDKAIESKGEKPEDWIPEIYKLMDTL